MSVSLEQVAQVLQVGFTGFAFLMTGYSASLILKEQARNEIRKNFLASLRTFMAFSLAMTVLSLGAVGMQQWIELSHLERMESSTACYDAISALAELQAPSTSSVEQLRHEIDVASAQCRPILATLGEL